MEIGDGDDNDDDDGSFLFDVGGWRWVNGLLVCTLGTYVLGWVVARGEDVLVRGRGGGRGGIKDNGHGAGRHDGRYIKSVVRFAA